MLGREAVQYGGSHRCSTTHQEVLAKVLILAVGVVVSCQLPLGQQLLDLGARVPGQSAARTTNSGCKVTSPRQHLQYSCDATLADWHVAVAVTWLTLCLLCQYPVEVAVPPHLYPGLPSFQVQHQPAHPRRWHLCHNSRCLPAPPSPGCHHRC